MRTTVNLKLENHKKLKEYCKEHDLKISEVLDGLVHFITLNQIPPVSYLKYSKTNKKTGRKDVFTMQEEILNEIKKNRNTYVSFQRTYEKQYEKDINIIKENIFFNTRKIIVGITKGQQYDKVMTDAVQFLSLLVVEELITEYVVSPETALEILEEYSKRLFDERELYMRELEKMSKIIAIKVGTLLDKDKNQTSMTTKRKAKKLK